MMIDNLEKNKCNGCYSCYNICSVDAIDMTPDKEGFNYPVINYSKCIQCGRCDVVCPIIHPMEKNNRKVPDVIAAWSLNQEIRMNSTSGGVFSELARKVLKRSGYVCGAVYNGEHMVEHFITNNLDELEKLRQSKYVQSSINIIYKKIGDLLNEDKEVLFCGTPCECGGLYSYLNCLNISMLNLILIDFVCRGSNSPKVYQMFLKRLETEYKSKVESVWFKNKTFGWNRFSTKIEFKNGRQYLQDRFSDSYIRGYIEANLYIRPSCGECAFKGFPRISDITLGDFWGVELEDKKNNPDGGTSLVIINSSLGDKLLKEIKSYIFLEKKTIEDSVKYNSCIYESIVHGTDRDGFMKDLDQLDIIENINRFLH